MTSQFGRNGLTAAFVAAAALLSACGGNTGGGTVAPANETLPPITGANSLPHHKTFRYTGYDQKFIVPPHVSKITVVALGASGGGSPGQRVGWVFAVIPVTPARAGRDRRWAGERRIRRF